MMIKNVEIAKVCGLCAGCNNAVNTAENELKNSKVALFKEIVHNKNTNKKLTDLGIRTIIDLNDAKADECIILRAHGEPPETYEFLKTHNLKFVDCTCENVTKIHNLARDFSQKGYKIILIGKYGKNSNAPHPEVFGTIGWCNKTPMLIEDEADLSKLEADSSSKYYLLCQTTFNEQKADELIKKITVISNKLNKELIINKTICFAQKAINISSVELAKKSDIMIVVGGKNSSNSKELFENVKNYSKAIFIEDINEWLNEIKRQNIEISNNTRIGLTAGASTLKEELITLKHLIETEEITNEN